METTGLLNLAHIYHLVGTSKENVNIIRESVGLLWTFFVDKSTLPVTYQGVLKGKKGACEI